MVKLYALNQHSYIKYFIHKRNLFSIKTAQYNQIIFFKKYVAFNDLLECVNKKINFIMEMY